MNSVWTVQQVVGQIVNLGLVDAQTVAQELGPDQLDVTLDDFGDYDDQAVLGLLDDLGIVHTNDYKSFRHICEGGLEQYQDELQTIAACGRGLLSVTDVELVDHDEEHDGDHDDDEEDEEHLLRFCCNGQLREWSIDHGPEEDFDAQLTFATSMNDFVPVNSPARWCNVEPLERGEGQRFVFGDPDALRKFGSQFGLTFDPV